MVELMHYWLVFRRNLCFHTRALNLNIMTFADDACKRRAHFLKEDRDRLCVFFFFVAIVFLKSSILRMQ